VDADKIFSLAQLKDWLWAKYKMKRTSFSYSDWNFSLVLCLQSLASQLLRYGWMTPLPTTYANLYLNLFFVYSSFLILVLFFFRCP